MFNHRDVVYVVAYACVKGIKNRTKNTSKKHGRGSKMLNPGLNPEKEMKNGD